MRSLPSPIPTRSAETSSTPLPTYTATTIPTHTTQPTPRPALTNDVYPTPQIESLVRERREIRFWSADTELAGELDLPRGVANPPIVIILHHSGPVPRDAYGYLAELLLDARISVFRFDKRGVGLSGGDYGCCEAEDALAAYHAALAQPDIDHCRVFIIAQSIGTQHLADQYDAFASAQMPRGVVLLSNLLHADRIIRIRAPVLVMVADSEPDLAAIGPEAVLAHQQQLTDGASLYIAEHAEHTLFDVRAGPIDWSNPVWVQRYHRGAMEHMLAWIQGTIDQTHCAT